MGTIHTAKVASVGTVLVNSSGRTLYLFTPDKQKSVTCSGACAKVWPPLFVHGSAVAGSGTKSSLLGTIKAGGKTVVTYNHWPLYTFAGDKAAGQAKGQGVEKVWFAVTASGAAVKGATTTPATTTPPTTAKKGSKSGGSVGY